jgi:hypothetical protein
MVCGAWVLVGRGLVGLPTARFVKLTSIRLALLTAERFLSVQVSLPPPRFLFFPTALSFGPLFVGRAMPKLTARSELEPLVLLPMPKLTGGGVMPKLTTPPEFSTELPLAMPKLTAGPFEAEASERPEVGGT